MASNTGQTLIALLTGAAIGAGIGILYAPDKGSNTREKLGKEAKSAQKKLNKQIKETTSNLSSKAQVAKLSFEKKFNETLSSASYKADDILMAMEDKLESLRKQNAKLQIDSTVNKASATVDHASASVKKATI